jgi:TonB family protein
MTRHIHIFLALIALTAFVPRQAQAGNGVRIIANPSVKADSISSEELKSVFLEERSSLVDGSHVEPVISKGGAAHEIFVKLYLGKSDSDLQNYYRTLVFTGKGSAPKAVGTDTEIAAYVAKTRGAIGYVSSDVSVEGVKTLSVLEAGEASRRLITHVEPVYPPTLHSNRIGGIVRLKVTVAPNGSVEAVELLGGNPILGDAAIAAVKHWVYAAGQRTKLEISVPFDPER